MRHNLTFLTASVLALLAGSAQAKVADTPNRYSDIPKKNVFRLKSPDPAPPPPQPALPKLVLTGITTILGDKRVLLKALPPPGKPGEQAKEVSMILSEGQREGNVEIMQIDETAGTVKVKNSGTEVLLTFEKDGAKLPSTPPPGPSGTTPPALPAFGAVPQPTNPITPPVLPMKPNPLSHIRTLPNRQPRGAVTAAGVSNAAVPGTQPAPAAQAQLLAEAATAAAPNTTEPQDLTAEEQMIVQQLRNEAAARQMNNRLPATPNQGQAGQGAPPAPLSLPLAPGAVAPPNSQGAPLLPQ